MIAVRACASVARAGCRVASCMTIQVTGTALTRDGTVCCSTWQAERHTSGHASHTGRRVARHPALPVVSRSTTRFQLEQVQPSKGVADNPRAQREKAWHTHCVAVLGVTAARQRQLAAASPGTHTTPLPLHRILIHITPGQGACALPGITQTQVQRTSIGNEPPSQACGVSPQVFGWCRAADAVNRVRRKAAIRLSRPNQHPISNPNLSITSDGRV